MPFFLHVPQGSAVLYLPGSASSSFSLLVRVPEFRRAKGTRTNCLHSLQHVRTRWLFFSGFVLPVFVGSVYFLGGGCKNIPPYKQKKQDNSVFFFFFFRRGHLLRQARQAGGDADRWLRGLLEAGRMKTSKWGARVPTPKFGFWLVRWKRTWPWMCRFRFFEQPHRTPMFQLFWGV